MCRLCCADCRLVYPMTISQENKTHSLIHTHTHTHTHTHRHKDGEKQTGREKRPGNTDNLQGMRVWLQQVKLVIGYDFMCCLPAVIHVSVSTLQSNLEPSSVNQQGFLSHSSPDIFLSLLSELTSQSLLPQGILYDNTFLVSGCQLCVMPPLRFASLTTSSSVSCISVFK